MVFYYETPGHAKTGGLCLSHRNIPHPYTDLPKSYITSKQRSQAKTLHFISHFTAKASQKAPLAK